MAFSTSVVEAFVRFIYTAHIGDEFETLVELMKIGNKYLVDAGTFRENREWRMGWKEDDSSGRVSLTRRLGLYGNCLLRRGRRRNAWCKCHPCVLASEVFKTQLLGGKRGRGRGAQHSMRNSNQVKSA